MQAVGSPLTAGNAQRPYQAIEIRQLSCQQLSPQLPSHFVHDARHRHMLANKATGQRGLKRRLATSQPDTKKLAYLHHPPNFLLQRSVSRRSITPMGQRFLKLSKARKRRQQVHPHPKTQNNSSNDCTPPTPLLLPTTATCHSILGGVPAICWAALPAAAPATDWRPASATAAATAVLVTRLAVIAASCPTIAAAA